MDPNTLEDDEPERFQKTGCPHSYPNGTSAWVYTGTAYGGDDPRWFGEGRVYCALCGVDGDG